MKCAEVVIGPPGSGKTSYVLSKRLALAHRRPYTVNLDPGNEDADFDYSICTVSSVRMYQQEHGVGPNMSAKCILERFCAGFEEFFREHVEDTDYLLFDLPGQIEFFMCSDALNDMLAHLRRCGVSTVVVNLVDLVFFSNRHALVSSYLVSTLCIGLIESAQIAVISKCDAWSRTELQHTLRNIADVEVEESGGLYGEMMSFVQSQGVLRYEILDYENAASVAVLQMVIDRASGLFLEDDYLDTEEVCSASRDDVFARYE